MRIIIANTKPVDETKKIVERSTEDLFRSAAGGVVQISDVRKSWTGNTMAFGFTAAVAFFTTPIEGTVTVTEKEVTIDVVLPEAFRKFLPEDKLRSGIESRVKGLLT
jgi:hypothetical protein